MVMQPRIITQSKISSIVTAPPNHQKLDPKMHHLRMRQLSMSAIRSLSPLLLPQLVDGLIWPTSLRI